ncbi:MAG TPA: HAMP domain-containing sensor histidine kinase [Terracidiphilus sp.]|nr:HAMP domain-containing sensor histidine kinase [Terracidiphilus sp.]
MTTSGQSRRFLVAAPYGRDGELICGLLQSSGFKAERVNSVGELDKAESSFLMGLILTDEALASGGVNSLRAVVDAQPKWSDLPVLLLTSGPAEPRYAAIASQVRMEIRSVYLLDRPVRKEMLLSAVQVAYTARMKQLEMRDAATRQFQSDEALRNTEKLAVAGRLAATMAHEVNNPLEALSNLLYLVENCNTVDEAHTFGRVAQEELARISEIVRDTLRFHRPAAEPGRTDLGELARSAVALFRGKLRERGIVEDIVAPSTFAFCSPGEIRQAIVNLVGNSIDAMPHGGRLYVRVASLCTGAAPAVRVTVADTGSGIRADIRPRLFTQFFTTKGSRGTGLGLWLTRDIALRNRGRLRFRSRTGTPSGTAFSVYLPASPPFEIVQTANQARAEDALPKAAAAGTIVAGAA